MLSSSFCAFLQAALVFRSTWMGLGPFRLCRVSFFGVGVYSLPSEESLTGSCSYVPNHKQGNVIFHCLWVCWHLLHSPLWKWKSCMWWQYIKVLQDDIQCSA